MSNDLGKLSNVDLLDKFYVYGSMYGHLPSEDMIAPDLDKILAVHSELMLRLDYYDVTKKAELEERQHLGAKVNGLIKEVAALKSQVKGLAESEIEEIPEILARIEGLGHKIDDNTVMLNEALARIEMLEAAVHNLEYPTDSSIATGNI